MSPFEYGVAQFVLPGQSESGDRYVACHDEGTGLFAVIDGIGHGEEAAEAAKAAASVLQARFRQPLISLVEECHESLRMTRGVVMSLASLDAVHGMMTWLGVGNVQGVLLPARAGRRMVREMLMLRGGVVGSQLPLLRATVIPLTPGDTVAFATDGLRGDFFEHLSAAEPPQRAAERIVDNYKSGNDDALALLVRFTQGGQ